MTFGDLLDALRAVTTDESRSDQRADESRISAVVYDSRRATAGSVFVALRGLKADGSQFVQQAIDRGAAAIVSETKRPDGVKAPWIVVSDARLALALLADRFYNHPSRQIPVIAR